MKWPWQKPSVRVHCGMLVGCILVLIGIGVWICGPSRYEASTVGLWLREHTVGRAFLLPQRPWKDCYVTRVDGKVQILGDGGSISEEVWREHQVHLYLYNLSTDASGFLAPTTLRIRHRLFKPQLRIPNESREFFAFSQRWGLGLAPDENGRMTISPTLERNYTSWEFRPIWSGYVINSVALLGIFGILWVLAWVPRQIRHLVRKEWYHRGLCPMCAYNLEATPGQCPECGWGHEDEADEASA